MRSMEELGTIAGSDGCARFLYDRLLRSKKWRRRWDYWILVLTVTSRSFPAVRERRFFLAKLLLEKPDILLLDEPTNYLDAEHIVWLKRYLNEYENAFILISHDIPFLNSVINLIYHMDQQTLTRYPGDYDKFQEVYAARQAQIEAAYNRQQKEIADLKDFVARNKARVSTRNMAMSRQKKLDKMDKIELAAEKPKPEFHFQDARERPAAIFSRRRIW